MENKNERFIRDERRNHGSKRHRGDWLSMLSSPVKRQMSEEDKCHSGPFPKCTPCVRSFGFLEHDMTKRREKLTLVFERMKNADGRKRMKTEHCDAAMWTGHRRCRRELCDLLKHETRQLLLGPHGTRHKPPCGDMWRSNVAAYEKGIEV